MKPYINLLPFMTRIDEVTELLNKWSGGIEISTDGPHWHANSDLIYEKRRFEQHLGPIGVHLPIWELNLASVQFPELARVSFEMYKSYVEWSATFASHMVLHTHLYSTPIFHRREAQEQSKQYIYELGMIAERLGVDLLVENVGFHNKMLFNEGEFVQLFEEIPMVSALLDVGHAHINNWDIPKVIKALGPKCKALHLHDNDGHNDLHLSIGEGTMDWQPIWDCLKVAEHDYRAILEYNEDIPLDQLLQDVQLLHDNLAKETI
jgi:sugar phosphate isomerase/epimerase